MGPMNLRDLCAQLGSTEEEVAVFMYNLKTRVSIEDSRLHPFEQAMRHYGVKTWPGYKLRKDGIYFNDLQIMDFYFPAHIREFNERYARGGYPGLSR